jgi:type I restriction enzyme S subunit
VASDSQRWAQTRIAELATDITVGFVGSMSSLFVDEGIPLLRGQNIKPYLLDLANLKYISTETHKKWKKSALRPGDVVIVRVGYPGTACVIPSGLGNLNAASLVIVRPNPERLDPHFLSYVLNSPWGRARIKGRLVGAAQQVFNTHTAADFEIPAPPLSIQRQIARVLFAYDQLIENNQRRIQILESMTRALYHEWFVEFRFPGHEQLSRVESGLGAIPNGWQVKTIGELTAFLNRGPAPIYDDEGPSWVINQKCIRDGRVSLEPARRQARTIPPEKLVRFGDVLINSTGAGTLGRVAQVYEALDRFTVDTHVTIARPTDETDVDFFGLALCEQQDTFERLGTGATNQTELSRTLVAGVQMVTPPVAVQRRFGALVRPMRSAVITLSKGIINLGRTRDLLLPRLISGELVLTDPAA